MIDGYIKIDFSADTKHGKFSDALYLRSDHNLTEEQIEALKQERVDNWLSIIEPPLPEVVVTEE
jgi:hypothetical protein